MLKHALVVAVAILPAAFGCASAGGESADGATSADELRALVPGEIVGSIAYGETKSGIAYDDTNTYRALTFQGAAGDEVAIDASAASADARLWLLAANYRTLETNDDASSSTNDARIVHRLTKTGTYYIVFREKNYEDASFTITLNDTSVAPPAPTPPPPTPAPSAAVYSFDLNVSSTWGGTGINPGSSRTRDTRRSTVEFAQGRVSPDPLLFSHTV
jgi:hypothetical protein